MPQGIREFARAKINLSLNIVGRRADGYHVLQSLVVFADVGDDVELVPGAELQLSIDGPNGETLAKEPDNLVLRAASFFLQTFPGTTAGKFTLHKRLPIAAGIGGGSADAAAALRCLMRANEGTPLEQEALDALVLKLGADVPVCLRSQTCFMTGIGEKIHDTGKTLPIAAVLANPNIAVATGKVFAALAVNGDAKDEKTAVPHFSREKDFMGFVRDAENDLEAAATELAPEIAVAKDALAASPGCWVARMSGSGATCFGLFENDEEAVQAAHELELQHPGWWIKSVVLG